MLQTSFGKSAIGKLAIGVAATLSGITIAHADEGLLSKFTTLSGVGVHGMVLPYFGENGSWKPTNGDWNPISNKMGGINIEWPTFAEFGPLKIQWSVDVLGLGSSKLHNAAARTAAQGAARTAETAFNTAEVNFKALKDDSSDKATVTDAYNKASDQKTQADDAVNALRTQDAVSGVLVQPIGVKMTADIGKGVYCHAKIGAGSVFTSELTSRLPYLATSVQGGIGVNWGAISGEFGLKYVLPVDPSVNAVAGIHLGCKYNF